MRHFKNSVGAREDDKVHVAWVDCGPGCVFVVSENGKLYAFGTTRHADQSRGSPEGCLPLFGHAGENTMQYGFREYVNEEHPREIALDRGNTQLTGVSVGQDHVVAWSSGQQGGVYTWGAGQYGQLGHPFESLNSMVSIDGVESRCMQLYPRQVMRLGDVCVQGAVAGWQITAVWDNRGKLYSFGATDDGRALHPRGVGERLPHKRKRSHVKWNYIVQIPTEVEMFASEFVINVVAKSHMLVSTRGGRLYHPIQAECDDDIDLLPPVRLCIDVSCPHHLTTQLASPHPCTRLRHAHV